jgi:hypothetical protein
MLDEDFVEIDYGCWIFKRDYNRELDGPPLSEKLQQKKEETLDEMYKRKRDNNLRELFE